MKVRELIAKLQTCDPDLMVIVDGYEGGVDELGEVRTVQIAKDAPGYGGYFGNHEIIDPDAWDYDEEWGNADVVMAIYLPRRS